MYQAVKPSEISPGLAGTGRWANANRLLSLVSGITILIQSAGASAFMQSLSSRYSILLAQWITQLLLTSYAIFSSVSFWKHFVKHKDKFLYILMLLIKNYSFFMSHLKLLSWEYVLPQSPSWIQTSLSPVTNRAGRRGQQSFTSLLPLVRSVPIPSFNDIAPGCYPFPLLFAIIHWSPCQPPHSVWSFVTSLLLPPTPASLLPWCLHPFTSLMI